MVSKSTKDESVRSQMDVSKVTGKMGVLRQRGKLWMGEQSAVKILGKWSLHNSTESIENRRRSLTADKESSYLCRASILLLYCTILLCCIAFVCILFYCFTDVLNFFHCFLFSNLIERGVFHQLSKMEVMNDCKVINICK